MSEKKRILIVGDELESIPMMKIQLESSGFNVAGIAYTGAKAINKAAEINPDIVLIDTQLAPTMDGIEAAAIIKKEYDIPVIFVTEYDDENTINQSHKIAPYGYITKPYNKTILQTTLNIALRLHEAEKINHKNLNKRNNQLTELNETYLHLYDNSPLGYLLIDKNGVIITANYKAVELLDINKEKILNKPLSDFIIEEDRDIYILNLKNIFELKTRHQWKMQLNLDATSPLHILALSETVYEVNGESLSWIVIQDISEYMHKEYELKMLLSAVEYSPACVVITDHHGTIQYVNKKFIELTGYTEKEAIGKNPRILKSGNTPDIVYKEMWETITAGKIWKGVFQNKNKSGEIYCESASIAPVIDEKGRITNFIAIKEDITGQINNMIMIQKREDDLKLVLNSTSEGIFGITGESIHVESDFFIRSDGTFFPVEYWSQPHYQNDKLIGNIVTAIDITERRNSEEYILQEYNLHLALSKIYKPMMKHNIPIEEIAEIILSSALFLTRSRHGYVSSIERITGENICHTLTEMIDNECKITDKNRRISFKKEKNGLFNSLIGHSLNTSESFFTNEPATHFTSKGVPTGNIKIEAFLSIPVLLGDEIVGQIALANPYTPYTDKDLKAIERLAEYYAIALNRKRDEEELYESERKFHKVITNIDEYIYSVEFDRDKVLSYYHSPNSLKVTGYDPNEYIEDPDLWIKRIFDDDRKMVQEYFTLKQRGEETPSFIEHRIIHKNGSIRWVSNSCTVESDNAGTFKRLDGFIIDITERKKNESIELFRSSTLELFTTDMDISTLLINIINQVEKIEPGIICSILLLDTERKHLSISAAPNLPDFFNSAIEGLEIGMGAGSCGTAAFTGETVIVENIVSHPYWASFRDIASKAGLGSCWSQPIILSGGHIAGTFSIYHKKAKAPEKSDYYILEQGARLVSIAIEKDIYLKQLSETINKLSIVMNNTFDLIIQIDLDSTLIFISNSHRELLHYEIKEMTGKSILEFIHPDDRDLASSSIARIKQKKDFKSLRIRFIQKGGKYLWVESSGKPICDNNNIVTGGIISSHDISNRLLFEDSLKEAKKAADKANQAKSAFIASMSHELRTPLNAIIGFGRILEMNIDGQLNDKQLKHIKHIRHSGDHLLAMINDILDLAKIESGKFHIDKNPFDIRKMLISFSEVIKSISKKKNINTHFNIENDIGLLNADEVRIRQIMYNLISNAIKFTDNGKDIGIEAYAESESITIIVWDNGIGIDKDDHERIFMPFEQIYNADHNIHGTGLGLPITKHLIELHNGQIKLESARGNGSKFIVTLPGRMPMTAEFITVQNAKSASSHLMPNGYSGNILVVEDNEINQELMKEILDTLGFNVQIVSTGEEAIEIAILEKFDMILMDIDLPGIDGIESMRRIRLIEEFSAPIVALTAYKMSGDEVRFISEGFDAVLNKPIDFKKLIETFNEYMPKKVINEKIIEVIPMNESDKYNIDEAAMSLGIPVERFKSIIIKFFNEKMENYLANLDSALSGKDYKLIKSEAHKLRGAMANLKFDDCAILLKKIEDSAEKEEADVNYRDISYKLKQILEGLKAKLTK